jgi:hypothetical protein
VVGLEGIVTLAGGQFRWDSTYSYGRAKGQAANPAIIQANYSQALDAVAGPGGTIVCRNPANGCSPLNLFGYGAPSEAAKNFVMGEATVASHTSQHDLTANLSGSLFSLPGGEAGVAVGIEYRHEYLEHLLPGAGFRFDTADFRGAQMFFWLYFVMTGFHAVHLAIGMGIVCFVAQRLWRGGPHIQTPESVEVTGLYWHFVDIVWIFLYPCLYLIARS